MLGLSTHEIPWQSAQPLLRKRIESLDHLITSLSKWASKAALLHPNMPLAMHPDIAKSMPRYHAAPLTLLSTDEREAARKSLSAQSPVPTAIEIDPDQCIVIDGKPRVLGSLTLQVRGEDVPFVEVLRDYQAFYCLMNQSETIEYHRLRRQFDLRLPREPDA